MAKKIFISFDYDNDKHYRNLLNALNQNSQFDLMFEDTSCNAINSNDVSVVKGAITFKIRQATHTLVIVGPYADERHKDYQLIGYKNWIIYEIEKSKECGNQLIAIKIDRLYTSPFELFNTNTKWAMSYNVEAITKANNGC
jgi:hypothetical protein